MKVVVKLALLLVAGVLFFTNAAFAASFSDCGSGEGDIKYCYEITATEDDGTTYTDNWYVCARPDGSGYLCSDNLGSCSAILLYAFSGGPGGYKTERGPSQAEWPAFVAKDATGNNVGYIWTPVYGAYLQAIGVRNGIKYTVEGTQVLPCLHPG
jgi:hypothetical protein